MLRHRRRSRSARGGAGRAGAQAPRGARRQPGACQGIGMVVPGMIDHATGRLVNAPALGWRDVAARGALAEARGSRCTSRAPPSPARWRRCGWTRGTARSRALRLRHRVGRRGRGAGGGRRGRARPPQRGGRVRAHPRCRWTGPRCLCGAAGCWEAYASNLAILSRYFGPTPPAREPRRPRRGSPWTDLVARARAGDVKARAALLDTGRYLGLGLAAIVNALNPARIVVGGEIAAAGT